MEAPRLEKVTAMTAIASAVVTCLSYFANDTARSFLLSPVLVPRWVFLVVLPLVAFLVLRVSSRRPSTPKDQVFFPKSPRHIRDSDPSSVGAMPSRIIRLPEAAISLWIYLPPFDQGIRLLVNNRYLLAHATNPTTYKNVFAVCRGPREWDPPRNPEWRLWLADEAGKGRSWTYPDNATFVVGWHHFLICWTLVGEPKLELLIDGNPVIHAEGFMKWWPKNHSPEIFIGCWPIKASIHYANTHFWRVQVIEDFPDQPWIDSELALPHPPPPG